MCGGDLHGDSDHPTVLDCPAGVVECSCGGNAVNACRCGTPEPVLASPSYGATVTSVVQAGSCYGWTSGGVVCVAAGRQGYFTKIVHSLILMWARGRASPEPRAQSPALFYYLVATYSLMLTLPLNFH